MAFDPKTITHLVGQLGGDVQQAQQMLHGLGEVDPQQHGGLLSQLGIDPQRLLGGGYNEHLQGQQQPTPATTPPGSSGSAEGTIGSASGDVGSAPGSEGPAFSPAGTPPAGQGWQTGGQAAPAGYDPIARSSEPDLSPEQPGYGQASGEQPDYSEPPGYRAEPGGEISRSGGDEDQGYGQPVPEQPGYGQEQAYGREQGSGQEQAVGQQFGAGGEDRSGRPQDEFDRPGAGGLP